MIMLLHRSTTSVCRFWASSLSFVFMVCLPPLWSVVVLAVTTELLWLSALLSRVPALCGARSALLLVPFCGFFVA